MSEQSAATSQPGKGRLGAACLSAKYRNRVGWGRGAGARPLASLAPSHPARSGGARRLQLPARLKQPAGAPTPPGVLGLVSASYSSKKLELPKHGPSGSSGAKRGAATPTPTASPLSYSTRQISHLDSSGLVLPETSKEDPSRARVWGNARSTHRKPQRLLYSSCWSA